jgi:hypothetical protein
MQNVKFELQNLADTEKKEPEEQKKPSFFRRLWNGLGFAAKGVSDTIFWFSASGEEEAVNPENLSQTVFGNYRKDFNEKFGVLTGAKMFLVKFWN